jgi:hypothetical protein
MAAGRLQGQPPAVKLALASITYGWLMSGSLAQLVQ